MMHPAIPAVTCPPGNQGCFTHSLVCIFLPKKVQTTNEIPALSFILALDACFRISVFGLASVCHALYNSSLSLSVRCHIHWMKTDWIQAETAVIYFWLSNDFLEQVVIPSVGVMRQMRKKQLHHSFSNRYIHVHAASKNLFILDKSLVRLFLFIFFKTKSHSKWVPILFSSRQHIIPRFLIFFVWAISMQIGSFGFCGWWPSLWNKKIALSDTKLFLANSWSVSPNF